MIDLHCHMLPGIDDGAPDLDTALEMARTAVADGITVTACTPHIYPGMFENTHGGIREACENFRAALAEADIPLGLTYGADIQITPDLVAGLSEGRLPTLNGSRYFLFEPPHHIAPPGMLDLIHNLLVAGYVPVITHPERLTYVEDYYDQFKQAAAMGAWLQITGGSLIGRFGKPIRAISERFLSDGITHLLATDAHNLGNRNPQLSEARAAAVTLVGEEEAERLVCSRPQAILDNVDPAAVPGPIVQPPVQPKKGFIARLFG